MSQYGRMNTTSVFLLRVGTCLDVDLLESVLSAKLSDEVDKCDFQRKVSMRSGPLSS